MAYCRRLHTSGLLRVSILLVGIVLALMIAPHARAQPNNDPVPKPPAIFQPVPDDRNAPAPPIFSPNPPPPPLPEAPAKSAPRLSIRPRTGASLNIQYKPLGDGTTAVIVTGGVTLLITATDPRASSLDIEADRVVIWTKGAGRQLLGNTAATQDLSGGAHEIYMAGNVEIRTRSKKEVETLRADEVYFDVRRQVAVARQADLEILQAKLPYPIHVTGQEIIRENEKIYKVTQSSIFASALPSNPGLRLDVGNVTVEEREAQARGLLAWWPVYDTSGQKKAETERVFTGRNLIANFESVPFFYFPYLRGRVEDPLGPVDSVNFNYNSIFGAQFYTTWDIYDLLGVTRPEGTRWKLLLDYLTLRGPGFGTEYDFSGKELFGTRATYSGMVRLYGIFDKRADTLGGDRGIRTFWPDELTSWPIEHPTFRGWAHGKVNVQDMPEGFSVLGQFSFLRERNFLEQYYPNIQYNELNQDTYLYLKQQQGNAAWSLLGQISTRGWMTETDWLPKGDFYWLGQTFYDDWFVYNVHASAGYGRLRPSDELPFAFLPNDVRRDAVRLDLWQDISLPFYLGPVKVAPYLVGDLAYYSRDVAGDDRGRLYGGGGVRWSMPLSRLYPEIQSDLFNLDGLYHKVALTGNYHIAHASSGAGNFPLFDRLNDDATDQALRDIRPRLKAINPANAAFLTTSPIFNPQTFAIRRLIDSNVDTFDDMHVIQLGLRQRWQTKRGFPGNEHVIDWMTFNLGVSVFPQSVRDNFGKSFGILEYDWTWNVGDRTALVSSGWFEPWQDGPRAFDVGAVFHRPDSTALYVGYRQADPINSKAVVASVVFPFSGKYAMTANTVWDFGVDVRSYSLLVSRMGTDVMFNFGINYNSTLNTVGVIFEILPNLARGTGRTAGLFPMAANNIDPMINVR